VLVVIGTSAVVHPPTGVVFRVLGIDAAVIDVNPDPVLVAPALQTPATAKEILPRIFRTASSRTGSVDEGDSG